MNGLSPFQKTKYLLLVLVVITIFHSNTFGQSVIGVASYMKVDNVEEFLELEKKWGKINKVRLKEGMIKGWAVYQVMFKTPQDPYNYISVSWYDSFSKLDKEIPNEIYQAAFPEMTEEDIKDFNQKTTDSHIRISAGVFHQRMTCVNGLDSQGKFYVINEIKVQQGKSKEFIKIYEEIYKPLFEEDIRNNHRTNWSFWEKWPGDLKDFQYLSADGYSSLEQIDQVNYLEYFSKIHPDKDPDEISKRVEELRELVSTEMWKLIYRAH